MSVGRFTHPRLLLKPNEIDLYDLMLKQSKLLREAADGGIVELHELMVEDIVALRAPVSERARNGLHAMLTYAFTCGAAFAVDQQVKNALKVVEHMRPN